MFSWREDAAFVTPVQTAGSKNIKAVLLLQYNGQCIHEEHLICLIGISKS